MNLTTGFGIGDRIIGGAALKRLEQVLLPNEQPEIAMACFDGKNFGGALVATNIRVIFIGGTIGQRTVRDFRYDQITSVDLATSIFKKPMLTLMVLGNSESFSACTPGVSPKFAQHIRSRIVAAHQSQQTTDPVAQLERLAKLKEAGHITAGEFEEQKRRLLG